MMLNLYDVTFLYSKCSPFSNIDILYIIQKDLLWRLRTGYKHGPNLSILRKYCKNIYKNVGKLYIADKFFKNKIK